MPRGPTAAETAERIAQINAKEKAALADAREKGKERAARKRKTRATKSKLFADANAARDIDLGEQPTRKLSLLPPVQIHGENLRRMSQSLYRSEDAETSIARWQRAFRSAAHEVSMHAMRMMRPSVVLILSSMLYVHTCSRARRRQRT